MLPEGRVGGGVRIQSNSYFTQGVGVAFPNKGLVGDQEWDHFLSARCRGRGGLRGAEHKQPLPVPSQGGGQMVSNHVHLCNEWRDLKPG